VEPSIEDLKERKMPSMEEMLDKYDTDGTMANLLEMERTSSESMLEPEELAQVLHCIYIQIDIDIDIDR